MSAAPKHKVIACQQGERRVLILVDAFNLHIEPLEEQDVVYVLTHAHADHYTGLQHSSWLTPGRRKICANEVTARLVNAILGVPMDRFSILQMNTETEIHPGVMMTMVDANHCPGACMALIQFGGRRILHTGDFRYSTCFKNDPKYAPLQDFVSKGIESIYLDTTYCHPRHASIPERAAALVALGSEVEKRKDSERKTLHLISTYTIGKERVLEEIASRMGCEVVVDARKYSLLHISGRDMGMYKLESKIESSIESSVRAVKWGQLGDTWPYFRPNYAAPAELAKELGYERVVGYVPTGWVSTSQQTSFSRRFAGVDIEIILVPYSEHSSYNELQEFVRWVRPKHVIPTVGADNDQAAGKIKSYFRHLVDANASKADFIAKLKKRVDVGSGVGGPGIGHDDEANGQEDVIVLLDDDEDNKDDGDIGRDRSDDAKNKRDNGETNDNHDIIIISETSPRASDRKQTVQASIKRYSILSLPPKNPAKKSKTLDNGDVFPATSPRFSLSPSKTPAIVITGKPAIEKAIDAYHPKKDAGFAGTRTPYVFLAEAMEAMEGESSRLAKERILVNVFRTCLATSQDDAIPTLFMLLGRIADEQDGLELNIGGSTLVRCVSDALGVSVDRLKSRYREVGDMGTVAASSKTRQRVLLAPLPMSVSSVYTSFMEIARTTGKGSVSCKKKQITKMLRGCTSPAETKFCVRALISNMRIGANWRSVLPAFAKAAVWYRHDKVGAVPPADQLAEAANRMLANYCRCPSVPRCCQAAIGQIETTKETGETGDTDITVEILSVQLGVPFKPMLAKPAGRGIGDALSLISKSFDTSGNALCELKYDGMRAIIHADVLRGKVIIYSRNAEDRTSTFDTALVVDVLGAIADGTTDLILDGEICAVAADGTIDSFQKLSSRATNGCSLRVVLFDLVQVNGRSLIEESLEHRRNLLRRVITASNSVAFAEGDTVPVADLLVDGGADRLRGMLTTALAGKAEGLMVKSLSGTYECMQRSSSWLKLKKDYCEDDEELGETFDVRVIGAWWGNGRKAGWYSPFLVAVFDEISETWQSLCRVLSGFSNEFYIEATARLSKCVVESKPFEFETLEKPPVWFDTSEVWEIRGADLQLSPVHRAGVGIVDATRGLGLRFPRFVRVRDDKRLEDVTTGADVAELFR